MTFNSVSFFAFFPLAVLVCWLVPRRWQNAALLAVSYAFYCFNTPAWLPVLVLDSLATWALVRRMDAAEGLSRKRRLWAALGVNLGLLVLLKGVSLLLHGAAVSAGLWQALSRLGLASEAGGSAFSVILPLGISFFTVQSVGYAVDVYRKKYAAEPSACNFALFVSFFPLISSGPIMRGDKLLPQLRAPRALRTDRAAHALVTFALGLFSKVAVADLLAVFANAVYGDVTAYTGLTLTFGALCYGLQLYFDFSGYSLMALGAAELLGLQLTTNFDTPYFSRSIREFWGRWHISFSSWLKDYVYIPLGGNRKGKARKYLNLLLTFLVSGVWHGVGLTYLIWGALHGVYQIAGDATDRLRGRVYAALHVSRTGRLACAWQCLCTFALVNAAWVFFRAASVHDALYVLTAQFRNVSLTGLLADIRAIAASFNAKSLLSAAFLAFVLLALAGGVLLDCARRFKAPGGDLSARMLSLPLIFRWLLYYALAAFIFAGFLMNNGYFATAANFLYNNF